MAPHNRTISNTGREPHADHAFSVKFFLKYLQTLRYLSLFDSPLVLINQRQPLIPNKFLPFTRNVLCVRLSGPGCQSLSDVQSLSSHKVCVTAYAQVHTYILCPQVPSSARYLSQS
jgi:hypothetical protein